MFQLGKTIVSEDILDKDFVCNLSACKGECCVAGAAGAPVEDDERAVLEREYESIKPFLRPEGIAAIDRQGTWIDREGEYETPLVQGEECAYTIFDADGTAKCGIEAAHNAGATDFYKPISCHLYPVRVRQYSSFTALNYHRWPICNPACTLGKELQVPIYKFLKTSLTRAFGEGWYAQLEQVAAQREAER